MGKFCQICGKNSGIYPLCKEHLKLKDEGKVVKDNKTNKWILLDDDINEENTECILCNKECYEGHLFCYDCYNKVKQIKKEFNHNRKEKDIQSHYFDIRDLVQKTNKVKQIEDYFVMMQALAEELYNIYDNDYLISRVYSDILSLYNNKKQNLNKNNSEQNDNFNDKDFREMWPREHQCEDGHYVRSLSEMLIDNWLYNHGYLHAYEKSVYMDTDPEAIVLSDFYLPQGNVYIEFWGIEDNEKYIKRKEQKIKLYNDNDYNRIDLTEKDIKRMDDIMPRKLGEFIKRKK